jgi:hypothetical protein
MAPRRTIRNVLVGCGLLTAFVAFGGLLSEATFRVIKASFGSPPIYQYDEDLGWAPIPNVSYGFAEQTNNSEADVIQYTANHLGFRLWGNPAANRPRILFVGDSFTQDANMSDGAAYFSQVAETLPVEVFAIGGGGYGTLQEVLLLERYWDVIEPTHVVIQFCSNDYSNNHYDSETFSMVRNQKHFRPYLVDGEIMFRDGTLYKPLYRYSMLFDSLISVFKTCNMLTRVDTSK